MQRQQQKHIQEKFKSNTVSPGLVDTPLAKKSLKIPLYLKASVKMLALDKIGKPKQISNIIKFLINPEMTGLPDKISLLTVTYHQLSKR